MWLRQGSFVILLVSGLSGVWGMAVPTTKFSQTDQQTCSFFSDGDRAFVKCTFTVDVGKERMNFHMMSVEKPSANVTSGRLRLVFSCFWTNSSSTPRCNGDDGYNLASSSPNNSVIIEFPMRFYQVKTYVCQIDGRTDLDLAEPCCAPTTENLKKATKSSLIIPPELAIAGLVIGAVTIAAAVAVLLIWRKCKSKTAEVITQSSDEQNETEGEETNVKSENNESQLNCSNEEVDDKTEFAEKKILLENEEKQSEDDGERVHLKDAVQDGGPKQDDADDKETTKHPVPVQPDNS